jgi:excisionase family DNA binding protein
MTTDTITPRPPRRRTEVPEADRLLTVEQVADLLAISVRTAWSLRSAGKLRAVKVGPRATRFRREDVAKLIERGAR